MRRWNEPASAKNLTPRWRSRILVVVPGKRDVRRGFVQVALLASGAALVSMASGACSSSSHPPEAGDCIGTPDAACSVVTSSGGGSGAPHGDGGSGSDTGGGEAASGCGTAGTLVATSNIECAPCITTSCCQADQDCSNDPSCLAILQCTAGINACESSNPKGVADYNDFAACLLQNCNPMCPTLPQSTTGDF
jgi:hypothetical protein